ncbi:hypothetical protein [Streptomyces sp.]|uniref:hypothetical protein n=1 Tax=Streptomyces sp. TaxID=1931 RepID=UPI002F91F8CC
MSQPERPEHPEDFDPERRRGLAMALAAFNLAMDEVVTESQYFQGRREDPERVAYLGDIIERAAARQRERERAAPS